MWTRSRREICLLAGIAVLVAATSSMLALSRWNTGLVTNYDLGIFAQSARSYAAGEWPFSDIRQLPLLGDHFSPVLALNGAAWWLWPDPRVLLVVQSLLLALASFIVASTVRSMLGMRWALPAMLVLSGGVGFVAAGLFDFHETAYAAPIVAVACRGIVERSWPLVVVTSGALLLVKEDLGLTVLGIAACWLVTGTRREWGRAVALAALGVAGIVVALTVIALVNPAGGSEYLSMFGVGEKKQLTGAVTGGLLDVRRLIPFGVYTCAALVVGWRSPLTLVALPTLVWRSVSSNALYWTPEFHYDVIPAVVGMMAAADAVLRRRRAGGAVNRAMQAVMAVAVTVTLGLAVMQAAERLPHGVALTPDPGVGELVRLARHAPHDARVATLNNTGTYLVSTHAHVHHLQLDHPEPVRFVLFADGEEWADRYPEPLRRRLLDQAARTPGAHVWRAGRYTLIDLGVEQRLPGTHAP